MSRSACKISQGLVLVGPGPGRGLGFQVTQSMCLALAASWRATCPVFSFLMMGLAPPLSSKIFTESGWLAMEAKWSGL